MCPRTGRVTGASRSCISGTGEATMLALLKSRALLTALGLVLLAIVLWFAGPYFAFADHRPLESVVARLIAIIVLMGVYAVYLLLKQMRSTQANRQLAEGVTRQ